MFFISLFLSVVIWETGFSYVFSVLENIFLCVKEVFFGVNYVFITFFFSERGNLSPVFYS